MSQLHFPFVKVGKGEGNQNERTETMDQSRKYNDP
ncbi:hypothetical protein SAMN04489868_1185 [Pisciglobus halotolerans]|uniref:Uncharacterized protein n=1 Tax=Pisciglobus halotolerans TaxID=745365 RepID=A0A1I3CGA1_9LACT|nr:hypothetical protein SAMN04489868_1185 [Pisciglobus halotolerans]